MCEPLNECYYKHAAVASLLSQRGYADNVAESYFWDVIVMNACESCKDMNEVRTRYPPIGQIRAYADAIIDRIITTVCAEYKN